MISGEFLHRIRRIQITTSRLVTDVFAGQYHSVFKGQGIEFDEVRAYTPGDEIRSIDWNVTARLGQPYVKKFMEERELAVVLLLDVSSSCGFASRGKLKSQLAAEICSLLAFSAIKNNDKVSFLAFSDRIEKFIPARKGTRHVLRVIREALYQTSENNLGSRRRTDIAGALAYLHKIIKRKAVVFIISDFYSFTPQAAGKGFDMESFAFKKQLSITSKKHDCIAITLTDPMESDMPPGVLVALEDAETGRLAHVDTSDARAREAFHRQAIAWQSARRSLFRWARVDEIPIKTDKPYWQELIRFFKQREKRLRS